LRRRCLAPLKRGRDDGADDEIVRIAHLVLSVDAGASPLSELERAGDRLSFDDLRAVLLAVKLIEGKGYRILSDNPASVARARSIAALVGSSVLSADERDGAAGILFAPAHRQ
jgi:hypothetical protein